MQRPVNFTYEPWWTVLTLKVPVALDAPQYVWIATGPIGCQCGVERTHSVAREKAQCAAVVLSDPEVKR